MQTIGTCGNCGGPVQVPSCWGGSVPPVPECSRCGSRAANPYGQVIPMEPMRPIPRTLQLGEYRLDSIRGN